MTLTAAAWSLLLAPFLFAAVVVTVVDEATGSAGRHEVAAIPPPPF